MPDQGKLDFAVAHLEAAETIFREMLEDGRFSEQEIDFVINRLCAMAELVDHGNDDHDLLRGVLLN